MSTWSDMNTMQRNTLIGGLIGAEPVSQCFLAVDGKRVLITPYAEKDRGKVDAMLVALRASDELWQELKANNPQAKDEWRTQIEVEVERWHLGYSNTAGGAWMVVEWLVAQGYEFTLAAAQPSALRPHAVTVRLFELPGQYHSGAGATLEEAVCEVLLKFKAPEALVEQEGREDREEKGGAS